MKFAGLSSIGTPLVRVSLAPPEPGAPSPGTFVRHATPAETRDKPWQQDHAPRKVAEDNLKS